MGPSIRVRPKPVWSAPDIDGLETGEEEWTLSLARYDAILERATGISPADRLTPADCYRIGNRLQALVEDRKRAGAWDPELLEAYPEVNSLETILWLARLFRACHACHDPGRPCTTDAGSRGCSASARSS